VATGADFYADVAFVGGPRAERVAAGANDVHFFVGGVDSGFHGGKLQLTKKARPRQGRRDRLRKGKTPAKDAGIVPEKGKTPAEGAGVYLVLTNLVFA
jgi:hypothetical protein